MVKEAADSYVERHYQIFEEAMGEGPYTFGDVFTVLDIYIWMLAQWMPAEWLAKKCPKINRLVESAKVHPRVAPVQEWHFG